MADRIVSNTGRKSNEQTRELKWRDPLQSANVARKAMEDTLTELPFSGLL